MSALRSAFPDGMTPAEPYGPWHALAAGATWVLAFAVVSVVGVALLALVESRKRATARSGRWFASLDREWVGDVVRFAAGAVVFCSIFPLAATLAGVVRMTPADSVTSRLWVYEGEATVVDAESGKWPWVRLELDSGQQIVAKGLSPFELDEHFDDGDWTAPRHVTLRCQAWHRWFPGEGDYVSAWCENPHFGED